MGAVRNALQENRNLLQNRTSGPDRPGLLDKALK
jgi:hypothetical protein